MAETIRISKVVKEFNIGITTLTEFLKKKGFEVEASPNSKISQEAYDLAQKEFVKEISIKEESKKVILKFKELETVSIDDVKDKKEEKTEEKEILIKTTQVEPPVIKGEWKKEPVKEIQKKQEEKKTEEKPEVPVVKKKRSLINIDEELEQIIAETSKEKTKTKPKEKVVETPAAQEKETIKVTVKGKINLDELNTKTRPSKKSYKETAGKPKKEKPEVPEKTAAGEEPVIQKPAPVVEEAAEKPVEIEHIATRVEKLTGPKIINDGQKIDLSVYEPKKKDPPKERRGKRTRIKKDKIDVSRVGKIDKDKKDGRKKTVKPLRPEVDEDAVHRQIKETYARMTEGKGKTKSSKYRREKREGVSRRISEEQELQEIQSTVLEITEFVTVSELANMMNVPVTKVIEACMNLGLMVSINQRLDA
jgi:translation initiation factor IF-2